MWRTFPRLHSRRQVTAWSHTRFCRSRQVAPGFLEHPACQVSAVISTTGLPAVWDARLTPVRTVKIRSRTSVIFPQSFDLILIHSVRVFQLGCRKPMSRRWQSRSAAGRLKFERASFPADFERRQSRCVDGEAASGQLQSMPAVLYTSSSKRIDLGRTVRHFGEVLVGLSLSCLKD